jgi:MFS family permease
VRRAEVTKSRANHLRNRYVAPVPTTTTENLLASEDISDIMSGSPVSLRGHKEFRRLLFGSAASMVGSRLTTIAFPMLILAITGSAVTAGFAVFAVTAPSILVYIPAGALVDRWNPRWIMLVSEFGRGVAITLILGMLAFHRPNMAVIVCCAIAGEILGVFATLAERRYVSALAGPGLSSPALMRTEARTHAAVLVGRPLGGLLFGIGSLLPFAADAISFAVSIASLLGLPDVTSARGSGTALRQVGREIYDGLRFLCGDFRSRVTIALRTPMTLVSQALIMIFVVEAHGRDMSAIEVGSVLACSGIGGFLGALAGPRLRIPGNHPIIRVQLFIWGSALFILSISGASWQVYCMAGVMIMFGFTGAMGNVEFDAYLAARAPDMVGRLAGIERLTSLAASATGPAVGGILAQECGYQTAVRWLFALIVGVGLLSVLVTRARNRASRVERTVPLAGLEPTVDGSGNRRRKDARLSLTYAETGRARRSAPDSPFTRHGPSTGHEPRASALSELRHPEDAFVYACHDRPATLGEGVKSSARKRLTGASVTVLPDDEKRRPRSPTRRVRLVLNMASLPVRAPKPAACRREKRLPVRESLAGLRIREGLASKGDLNSHVCDLWLWGSFDAVKPRVAGQGRVGCLGRVRTQLRMLCIGRELYQQVTSGRLWFWEGGLVRTPLGAIP